MRSKYRNNATWFLRFPGGVAAADFRETVVSLACGHAWRMLKLELAASTVLRGVAMMMIGARRVVARMTVTAAKATPKPRAGGAKAAVTMMTAARRLHLFLMRSRRQWS